MGTSWLRTHLGELYRYRVLIDSLVRREVRARYRGSVLGYLWTLLNPLLLLAVYVLVFSRFTRAVTIENYALFLFSGILPWQWLASSITNGTTSIAHGGGLITRVCMPPQILPAVVVLSNLVNFLLALPVAVAAAALSGLWPSAALVFLPIAVANEVVFLYGAALIVATLTVRFRDVQFLVQSLLLVWFFLTPVAYPLDMVPERYLVLVRANPATALVRPFQEILFERRVPEVAHLALGAVTAVASLLLAAFLFEALRDDLAEEI